MCPCSTVANQNSSGQPLVNAAKTLAAAKKNGGRAPDALTSPSQGYNRSVPQQDRYL